MTHQLHVWLFTNHVGTLSLLNGRLSFEYTPQWRQNPNAKPLSRSLPLQIDRFDDQATRPFFAGLLPEGKMRQLIARQIQVSAQNDFALLDHLGGECAGAVTFLEPGQTPLLHQQEVDTHWLNKTALIKVLDELPQRPMLADTNDFRLSLAGAQDKLPVLFDGARIGLPRHGAPSSHILKPAIQGIESSVVNEGFCLTLANWINLNAVNAVIYQTAHHTVLLVERYDRFVDDQGHRQRIHQEDFCQAIGVVPEMKYQNEGGPNLAQCFDLIRQATRPSAPHLLRLFDYAVFNALIGNHDAHGKNFSLLYTKQGTVLAPFYDTLSTAVYPQLTPKMAMKLGDKYKFSEIYARHWERFANETNVAKTQAKKRILALAKVLPITARQLQADPHHGFSTQPIVEKIVNLIEQRCRLTLARLSDQEG